MGEERYNLCTYCAKSLHDFRLFMHFNVQSIGHFIVLSTYHDVMPLHFCLFAGQLLAFQLEAMILRLQKLKLLLDAIAGLHHRELKRLSRLMRCGMPALWIHPWMLFHSKLSHWFFVVVVVVYLKIK